MARGLSAGIKVELNKTNLALPIYCLRITRATGDVLRWADRTQSFDDGGGTVSYTARLMAVSGLEFGPDQAGQVSFTVVNADGAVTTLDRTKSFQGATCEFIAYLPGIDAYYVLWSGWCDEVSEISQEIATIMAYPTMATPNVQVPKTVVGGPCPNVFGNTANWTNARDFDGSECPYQRTSTIGFFANLVGAMNGSTNPVTFTVLFTAAAHTAGGKFKVGEYLIIGSEIILLTAADASLNGSHQQGLTGSRAKKSTAMATHGDNSEVKFQDCTYSVDGCTRRGMYGNNTSDSYTV